MKIHHISCLYILFITFIISFTVTPIYGQKTLTEGIEWRESCDSIFVFEITNKEALKFLKEGGSEKLMQKLLYKHVATIKGRWNNAPKQGHFIYASINKNKINYSYAPIAPFQVFLFREYGILTLQVIDAEGEVRSDAKVRIQNGKWRLFDANVPYDAESKVYRTDDWSENPKRILTVELDKFSAVFDLTKHVVYPSYGSGYDGSDRSGPDFYSYMITDKNKYKPGEKVRFKSYALTGGKKPIKNTLELWMEKPDRYHDYKKITTIDPYNPGGFAGELELHDSLKLRLDKNYSLQLRDKKGKVIAHSSFRYEDYELYDNKIETKLKDFTQYFPNDNEIEIKVVDANSLIMPDMKAQISISRGDIRNSYVDLLIVPNIIRQDTINLNNDTPTIYKLPASLFDKTDCTYKVNISALTPDGQWLTASHNIVFYKSYYDINYQVKDSTIVFKFSELGIEKNVPARISIDGKETKDVTLPHIEDFKQNIETYTIAVPEYKTSKNVNTSGMHHQLDIKGGLVKDSLVLELVNPLGLDVTWYIYEGNMLLEKGSGKEIDFKKPYIDLDVTYFLEIFFTMGGEDQVYRRIFAPKKEFLNIDWNMPDRIYPGQKVDTQIKITDSRGQNVKGVDITAFAYNSLLNYYVPDLPYYGNTPKGREKRDSYYIDEKNTNYTQSLTQTNFDFWNEIAHLDNKDYYRFTFPDPRLHEGFTDDSTHSAIANIPYHDIFKHTIDTPDGTTEFAPYVMLNGDAVDIYTIEVDEKPVYFSWTEQPKGYSFLVNSKSYHKISLRLHDRIIIIDRYCFDEGKKTILSINLNNMPKSRHVRTVNMPAKNKGTTKNPSWVYELDKSEEGLYKKYISVIPVIENRFTYMTQSSKNDTTVIPIYHPRFQERQRYYHNSQKMHQIVGPLDQGMYRYMDGVEYLHEGGFKYKYATNVVYKYPDDPYPTALQLSMGNNFSNLNDFHFTSKEFGRKIGLVPVEQDKWFPGVVLLSNTKIHIPKDKEKSGVRGVVMRNRETGKLFVPIYNRNILGSYGNDGLYGLKGMKYGNYDIFTLYNNGNYLRYNDIPLQPNTYVELKMDGCEEHLKDSISTKWLEYQPPVYNVSGSRREDTRTQSYSNIGKQHFNPANDVRGIITDEEGEALIGVTISLKNTQAGTISDINGEFILDLHGAENTLVFSYIGFKTAEMKVTRGSSITMVLKEDAMMLEEAVVVGYGTMKKSSITGSISTVLHGKASGMVVNQDLEDNTTEDEKVEDDGSAKLYNELMLLDGMRSNFSDVGFWEPKLVTDKKGEANFTVTFPDNITKWQAIVYAMNRKLKTGTLRQGINSYKPLMAEIKTPQFLVEGDSILFSTNIRNYTKDKEIDGEIIFVNNGDSILRTPIHFEASYQKYLPVIAPFEQDSLTFSYRFTRNDGYSDGEQRSISIEKQGVEIAEGILQFLHNGDNINLTAAPDEEVEISITGKQIDIYIDAANYLIGYKYACNEQLASKLIGLLNYRLFTQFKGEAFKYDKNVNEIIGRLLKNQNQNRLWSWWSNDSNTSYWMSAHILRALHMAQKAGYRVDLDIKKVKYDYIDIHRFRNTSLYDIDILNALADWGTEQSYGEIIELFENKIAKIEAHEDSLVNRYKKTKKPEDYAARRSYLTQKLTLIEMRQKLGMEYNKKLITDHINKDVLGAVNIKDTLRSNYWYYDNDAANVIAYRIMRNDSTLHRYVDGMQMYILGTKRYGWNTYQASSALMTILPDLLAESTTADNQATVILSGKVNKSVKEFPYYATLKSNEQLSIRKESGMPLIYSAYTLKRRTEEHFGEAFEISTAINRQVLEKGVPVRMEVTVKVKQDNAEHVIIEIPVPAGCSYQNKYRGYSYNEVYREYFKEKVAIFCEKLPKGEYKYSIDLIPRYSGRYILNPAKVEMMYFPVINSNNDMEKINIK
ncbi:MAG: carboxypeptidase-like regulatory domain-containing protein [Dysgonomonas sp.]|nr:carboxypeptidase-like regulatory domain-containing protein [Dysgonomonas sp.]